MADYTQDYLLNKQIRILQPINGYRASTDAVFLASAVSAVKPGEQILDVGSGTGAISLCLASRFKESKPLITGVEMQNQLTELSAQSASLNGFAEFLHYENADIFSKTHGLTPCSFNHVITNPPYSEHDLPSPNPGKALAHNHHGSDLANWLGFCIKMLRPQGKFYMVHRAEAVASILSILNGRLGKICLIPIYSKSGQNAKRVIITAQKDSHAPAVITPGFTIHDIDGNYTPQAQRILREGLGLFD